MTNDAHYFDLLMQREADIKDINARLRAVEAALLTERQLHIAARGAAHQALDDAIDAMAEATDPGEIELDVEAPQPPTSH